MSTNGYSDRLIAIDDEMVALGRPLPPVVSWLSGGRKGDLKERTRVWHEQIQAWEESSPEKAIRWEELRAEYEAQDELERRAKFDGSEDAWNYVLLESIGVPKTNLDLIQREFTDNSSLKAARDWHYDGAWSLTLIGMTGCGKSTAAAWIAHQRLMRQRWRPVWVDCVKQCEKPMYGVAAEHLRFKCRTAPMLVLDDLGSGRRERESQFWLAWLDDVIGSRANEARKTAITTNRTVDELKAWLGDRLFDRLRAGIIHSTAEKSLRGQQPTQNPAAALTVQRTEAPPVSPSRAGASTLPQSRSAEVRR